MTRIKKMSYESVSSKLLFRILRCLVPASYFAASLIAQNFDQVRTSSSRPVLRARAVLGLEGVANNSGGNSRFRTMSSYILAAKVLPFGCR